MAAPQNFRTAFNGFHKEDVVRYLEYINSKHTNQINQLTAEAEELRQQVPVIKGNEVIAQKEMGFGLVSDERFCDGLYFALSLRKLRRFMQNPAVLEKPLDKKVEDLD